MSADNGWVVTELFDKRGWYGIFSYCASVDEPADYYSEKNARDVVSNPIAAIILGHRTESFNPTEYGVHVNAKTIRDAELVMIDVLTIAKHIPTAKYPSDNDPED